MSNNSLRTIYEDILQPLIGNVFDVNAALSLTDNSFNPELIEDQSCFCCTQRDYHNPSDGNNMIELEGKY